MTSFHSHYVFLTAKNTEVSHRNPESFSLRPSARVSPRPLRLFFLIITSFIFFFSCKNSDQKYPGFTQASSGVYYKLQAFGDTKRKATKDEYLELSMVFKTESDSVFLDIKNQNPIGRIIIPAADLNSKGLLGKGIMDMNEGDSVTFILDVDELFDKFFHTERAMFLHKNNVAKVDIKLHAILDKKGYEAELIRFDDALALWDVEEQRRIKNYVKKNNLNALQQPDGIYYIPVLEGKGMQADSGKTVMIKYTGCFISGQKFDSRCDTSSFEFKMGDEYQVIWGLQQGIKLMKEGGKAKFIIPSYLAFGEKGSSTGIVPPNTTVMYEVELIKVK
jgi:FKBP-type peptidyl-prolyl cis-trans isomerase FkpA